MAWSNVFVSFDGESIDSFDVTILTAPLTSPMPSLAATRLPNVDCEGLGGFPLVFFLGTGSTSVEPETNVSSLLLTTVA